MELFCHVPSLSLSFLPKDLVLVVSGILTRNPVQVRKLQIDNSLFLRCVSSNIGSVKSLVERESREYC